MDFVSNSTTETGSVRAIILSESIAETKALNSRYFGMKKSVLVTSEYNTNLIEPNTYYYLELVNSSIEKKILLSPIEIDSWIEKNK